jgi:hypothetical protein
MTSLLHLRQNLLYLYSFLYSRPNDGLVEAETCRNYIINDNCLFIIDGPIFWIKYNSYVDVRDLVSELKMSFPYFLSLTFSIYSGVEDYCCTWSHSDTPHSVDPLDE